VSWTQTDTVIRISLDRALMEKFGCWTPEVSSVCRPGLRWSQSIIRSFRNGLPTGQIRR
jgi:hypothetical protein